MGLAPHSRHLLWFNLLIHLAGPDELCQLSAARPRRDTRTSRDTR
jgi:hypothetical protein